MIGRLLLLALAAALSWPASAQPPVPTMPQRDVSVVYRLQGAARDTVPGGLPETVRLQWDATRRRLRVEPQGRTQVLLVDLGAAKAELLDSGLHSAIALPMRASDVEPITLRDARLTPRGSATVAGLRCMEYDVAAQRGRGTVCLTPDGIALRGSGEVDGKQGSFAAISVTPGPIPSSAFDVPPGYMHLAIPNFGQLR